MLSGTLAPIDGQPVGQHPLVVTLMKGALNTRPPHPRNSSILLDHLRPKVNEETSFKNLSHKLATLFALATLLRSSELAAIGRGTVEFADSVAKFSLLPPRKAQKGGGLLLHTAPTSACRRRLSALSGPLRRTDGSVDN